MAGCLKREKMNQRKQQFVRNQNLESLLSNLNALLAPVQQEVSKNFQKPRYPLILIVGCARSGSTLMMQWLASTAQFAYPTNFLSRFYASPYIGAMIQQMLLHPTFQYKEEFADVKNFALFTSDLGKTSGLFAPNEFYYFWRRFFQYGEIQHLSEHETRNVDANGFFSELASIESVFEKPLAMKGHLIGWNIPFFYSLFSNVIFVHVRRDPIYNAQSLLEAREKFYGDQGQWYSFKPVEYPMLKELTPYQQVAGQVYFTNRAVGHGLSAIKKINGLSVSYEEFCKSPRKIYRNLRERLAQFGYDVSSRYMGPESFEPANEVRLPKRQFKLISTAYEEFQGNFG
jgi:Sulfotransferase family